MAALAFQRHPATRTIGHQTRDPQAGARAEQGPGLVGLAHAPTHLTQLASRQIGQRQRQGGEVIEQAQVGQAELGLQRRLRERPVVVGHADLVTGDGVGDGDGRHGRPAAPQTRQVGVHGGLQRGEVGGGQHPHVGHGRAGAALPGKPGVGAAHIGQQSASLGYVRGHGGGPPWVLQTR